MATYYDSSALLAVLLGESERQKILKCWEADPQRLSSILLKAEVMASLRRASVQARLEWKSSIVKGRLSEFENYLRGITFRQIDDEVIEILNENIRFMDCRSLDALHLATACLFQQHLDEPLQICSLDQRMRQLAKTLKFKAVPEIQDF